MGFSMAKHQKDDRGFGSMDEDKQKDIASKGGKAAHEEDTAHEFDSEEARKAGKKRRPSQPERLSDVSRYPKQAGFSKELKARLISF